MKGHTSRICDYCDVIKGPDSVPTDEITLIVYILKIIFTSLTDYLTLITARIIWRSTIPALVLNYPLLSCCPKVAALI